MNNSQLARIEYKRKLRFLKTYKSHAFKNSPVDTGFMLRHDFSLPESDFTLHIFIPATVGSVAVRYESIVVSYPTGTGLLANIIRHEFPICDVPAFIIHAALCAGLHPVRCLENPKSAVDFFKKVGVGVSDLEIYQDLKCSPKETADSIRSALRMKASKATPEGESIDFDFSEVLA